MGWCGCVRGASRWPKLGSHIARCRVFAASLDPKSWAPRRVVRGNAPFFCAALRAAMFVDHVLDVCKVWRRLGHGTWSNCKTRKVFFFFGKRWLLVLAKGGYWRARRAALSGGVARAPKCGCVLGDMCAAHRPSAAARNDRTATRRGQQRSRGFLCATKSKKFSSARRRRRQWSRCAACSCGSCSTTSFSSVGDAAEPLTRAERVGAAQEWCCGAVGLVSDCRLRFIGLIACLIDDCHTSELCTHVCMCACACAFRSCVRCERV